MNCSANTRHSLSPELHSMVRKAMGMDSGLIDLVLVGDINWTNLEDLARKTESYIQRKIRVLVFTPEEFKQNSLLMRDRPVLLLWDDKVKR